MIALYKSTFTIPYHYHTSVQHANHSATERPSHPSLSVPSVKSGLVLPFWYRLTRVVPDEGPLNVCLLAVCNVAAPPVESRGSSQADGVDVTTADSGGPTRTAWRWSTRAYDYHGSSAGAATRPAVSPLFSAGVPVSQRRLLGHLHATLADSHQLVLSRRRPIATTLAQTRWRQQGVYKSCLTNFQEISRIL